VTPARRPVARRSCLGGLTLLGILGFVAFMTTVLLTVTIWPGEAKLTAPLFCGDDTPEAFVVVDRYSVQPGETSYNFSLYAWARGARRRKSASSGRAWCSRPATRR
jgi:hypothetical protein